MSPCPSKWPLPASVSVSSFSAQALFIHNAILPCLFNSLQGKNPVLQEAVLDQPALLNSFALQGTSQWDPAKQVHEEVKICSSKLKSVILLLALGTDSSQGLRLKAHDHFS